MLILGQVVPDVLVCNKVQDVVEIGEWYGLGQTTDTHPVCMWKKA